MTHNTDNQNIELTSFIYPLLISKLINNKELQKKNYSEFQHCLPSYNMNRFPHTNITIVRNVETLQDKLSQLQALTHLRFNSPNPLKAYTENEKHLTLEETVFFLNIFNFISHFFDKSEIQIKDLYVSEPFYPLFLGIIANINKHRNSWSDFRNHVLEFVDIYFTEVYKNTFFSEEYNVHDCIMLSEYILEHAFSDSTFRLINQIGYVEKITSKPNYPANLKLLFTQFKYDFFTYRFKTTTYQNIFFDSIYEKLNAPSLTPQNYINILTTVCNTEYTAQVEAESKNWISACAKYNDLSITNLFNILSEKLDSNI